MAFSCSDIDTLVHAYLDGELATHDLEELEQHIARCHGCRARVDDELQFRAELRRRLVPPPASDLLRARVSALLDAEDRAAVAAQRRRGVAWILPGAATLAAAAALVMVVEPGTAAAPSNENRPDKRSDRAAAAPPAHGPGLDLPVLQIPGARAKRATFDQGTGRSAMTYEVERGQSRHEMQMERFTDARDLPPEATSIGVIVFTPDGIFFFRSRSMAQEETRQVVKPESDSWMRGSADPEP